MKKLFLLSIALFIPIFSYSQGLDSNASYIKDNFPNEYQNTIRAFSVREWGNDHRMVVYSINRQADALMDIIQSFKSEHTQILFDAVQDWSHDGYKSQNIEKFRNVDTVNVSQMIGLQVDWTMVQYEYERQVEASQAY